MIVRVPFEKGLYGIPGVDTRYFGKDAEDFLESINYHSDIEHLGKECLTTLDQQKGIIVGIEDSDSFADYYYIVYRPEEDKVSYELMNDPIFVENIII